MRQNTRMLWLMGLSALTLFILPAYVLYVIVDSKRGEQAHKELADTGAKIKAAALAVDTLPKGVSDAWMRYADAQFANKISRQGNLLRVRSGNSFSYVSANMPYEVSCGFPLTAVIAWGQGEDGEVTYVFGSPPSDFSQLLEPNGPPGQPELGVERESVAARKLTDDLCARVATKMDALVTDEGQTR